MAQFPPGFPSSSPPPPWFSFPSPRPRPPQPPSSYRPPPPSSRSNDSSRGRVIAGIFIGIVAAVLLYIMVCSLCRGRRNRRATAAAAAAAGPQPLEETSSSVHLDERPLRHACAVSPTAGLPAFAYTLSVKRNVTGSADEVAMCSVCLGVMQLGETVRLLPVCLHLYHAECIDPWLDAHSTCPLCRSETDPTMGVGRI